MVAVAILDLSRRSRGKEHTSKVIHEMGSSLGISVRLTSLRVRASSSNSTVKMAPGGVHVPIIKWWRGILEVAVLENVTERTMTSARNAGKQAQ